MREIYTYMICFVGELHNLDSQSDDVTYMHIQIYNKTSLLSIIYGVYTYTRTLHVSLFYEVP